MAVLGSNGAGEKLSCGSVAGALCAGVEDLRPVNESQLDRKHELNSSQEQRGGKHTWPWWRVSVMWR